MKVILKQDVKGLGKKGDTLEVSEGHARNYLLPRGLAVEATAGNLKILAEQKTAVANRQAREEEEARILASRLDDLVITIPAKTGDKGRLFGSITSKDVAEAVEKTAKLALDKRKLDMPEPIKELGDYRIPVKLYPTIAATLQVKVVEANVHGK
ncbi:MAG: 50S ribosomal protein L9 [Syntrophothermus sp.]